MPPPLPPYPRRSRSVPKAVWLLVALFTAIACGIVVMVVVLATHFFPAQPVATVRAYQTRYLGHTSKEWLVLFHDKDQQTWFVAQDALEALADDDAIDGLIAGLKDEDLRVAEQSAVTLGHMEGKARRAIPALEEAKKDPRFQRANRMHTLDFALYLIDRTRPQPQ